MAIYGHSISYLPMWLLSWECGGFIPSSWRGAGRLVTTAEVTLAAKGQVVEGNRASAWLSWDVHSGAQLPWTVWRSRVRHFGWQPWSSQSTYMLNPKLPHHLTLALAVPSTRSAVPDPASFAWHLRIYQGRAAGETPVNETQRSSSQGACSEQKITGKLLVCWWAKRLWEDREGSWEGEVQAWPPGRVGARQVNTWRGRRHSGGNREQTVQRPGVGR